MNLFSEIYFVIFNGPPGSGKDTAAQHLFNKAYYKNSSDTVFDRMSMPLKKSIASWLGVELDQFGHNAALEKHKDQSHAKLGGKSYRQAQIDLSNYIIGQYGENIFGEWLANRTIERRMRSASFGMKRVMPIIVLVPDGGFMREYQPLIKLAGRENVVTFHMHREGKTFDNDSRSYTYDANCFHCQIYNKEGEWEKMHYDVFTYLSRFFQERKISLV